MARRTLSRTLDGLPDLSESPMNGQILYRTQAEQDQADRNARRIAMKDLVSSWNDRLQLISLITTFMASVEAGLLQITAPDPDSPSNIIVASNACLFSALILHLHASFISFIAAFLLVRYKIKEAKREEDKIEGNPPEGIQTPSKGEILLDMAANHITQSTVTESSTIAPHLKPKDQVWCANPHLVPVGAFFRSRHPPINLLSRCHFMSILCAVLGFLLAMVGIPCLAWARHPLVVSVVATSSLGLCFLSGVGIMYIKYETLTSCTSDLNLSFPIHVSQELTRL
ncbi:hypothetical protein V5O48_003072 [Marasmius crinis-equi]|uniref:Uncharacterized protein n=1 Tax=Marasmius crinis-equi TaxID=585013 RepID=A0ABR3FUC2_9AGAR